MRERKTWSLEAFSTVTGYSVDYFIKEFTSAGTVRPVLMIVGKRCLIIKGEAFFDGTWRSWMKAVNAGVLPDAPMRVKVVSG